VVHVGPFFNAALLCPALSYAVVPDVSSNFRYKTNSAALGGIDALVFCAGIGENSRMVRARVCERLEWMGIEIDHARNADNARVISSDLARTTVMVLPTNEELIIARAARASAGLMEQDVA
jgi:acetate kinase